MSISIADMERVALGGDALRMGGDVGDVIELGDLSDDLGLSMLMNPSKMGGGVNSGRDTSNRVIQMESAPERQVNFGGQQEPAFSFSSDNGGGNQQTINSIPLAS